MIYFDILVNQTILSSKKYFVVITFHHYLNKIYATLLGVNIKTINIKKIFKIGTVIVHLSYYICLFAPFAEHAERTKRRQVEHLKYQVISQITSGDASNLRIPIKDNNTALK